MNKTVKHITILVLALIVINFISSKVYKRFDLTSNKRYTLSKSTITIIKGLESSIVVDVFLEGDDFPSEFRRLKKETKQLLWVIFLSTS